MTTMSTPLWKLGFGAALAMASLRPSPVAAEVVYTVLTDGLWVVERQADLTSPPVPVREEPALDVSAPVLSPDGSRVAFEVPGQGIRVCPVAGSSECRTIQPEDGSAVRPAWNPVTGELVFVRYVVDAKGEESDLFTTRDGLAAISPLLLQTGNQDDPDISPDGRFLAYSSAQTISMRQAGVQVVRQLWILDLETGAARQLLAGDSQDVHPDWSPSGQEIAFASDREGDFDLWMIKADGSGLRKVTSGEGSKTWPAWSPDGKTLLFTLARDGRQDLFLIDADGSNLRPFRSSGPEGDVQRRDADWR